MRLSGILLLLFIIPAGLFVFPASDPPELRCQAAILYDLETGQVLYEKNADAVIPPASLTKLMSLHLAYEAVAAGRLTKDQLIPIGSESSFKASPPHSSLMFLERGQRVTLLELMKGLALSSGNDAGVALARAVADSMASFVDMMNSEALRLGLERTRFVDSSGYSAKNRTTPREFAAFCRFYIERHPEALEELHSLDEFTFPQEGNLPRDGSSTYGPITQYNHNILVGNLEGVDGLKTGYIDESGYNLAVTAKRGERRLLAVLMGGPGRDSREGSIIRAVDASVLISYGYYGSRTFRPALPELPSRRVFKGNLRSMEFTAAEPPLLTLPVEESGALAWDFQWDGPLVAPLEKSTRVGLLLCRDSRGRILFTREIKTRKDLSRGSFFRRMWDSLVLLLGRK